MNLPFCTCQVICDLFSVTADLSPEGISLLDLPCNAFSFNQMLNEVEGGSFQPAGGMHGLPTAAFHLTSS